MEKSVTKKNDQLSKKLDPQEVDLLVLNPMRIKEAAGNSLHDHLRGLDPEEQFRKIYESGDFMKRTSVGMRYRTIQDLNNGFGDRTRSCREYTIRSQCVDHRQHGD